MKYFVDTSALLEIIKKNPEYGRYVDKEMYTSLLNLYELYYIILRDYDEEKAREAFYQFFDFIVFIKAQHIFRASQFKLKHKKLNISYVDALGYAISEIEGMKFLTGDGAFKGIKNVEFVQ